MVESLRVQYLGHPNLRIESYSSSRKPSHASRGLSNAISQASCCFQPLSVCMYACVYKYKYININMNINIIIHINMDIHLKYIYIYVYMYTACVMSLCAMPSF